MKNSWGIFIVGLMLVSLNAHAVDFPEPNSGAPKSFLSANTFPKTFDDLSFVERTDVLRAGYEPWESEYDDLGRCISNCAYPGITIEKDLEAAQRYTDMARVAFEMNQKNIGAAYQAPVHDSMPSMGGAVKTVVSAPRCVPFNGRIPVNQTVPFGKPLLGQPRITSPFGERTHPTTGKRQAHKAIDFAAPIGTDVYVPADGIVESIWTDDTCGRGLRIKHADGYASLYCHLNDYSIDQGDAVKAGCAVAKTGNTGRSTGPHLHYGLYYNNNLINPTEYINR